MRTSRILTRTILLVSFVSLFTDVASEMLYPIMPVYLRSIGFSVLLIGILEGVAEAVAGLSKGYFGQFSDRQGKRVPFVRTGYCLSAFSKPMIALLTFPWWIFIARTMDRLGKGVRTAARDAILSDESSPEHKGRVFGFHRGMDTAGAALGPALALIYLAFFPGQYRYLFYFALVPGLIAVALTFYLKEGSKTASTAGGPGIKGFFSYLSYWKKASSPYKFLVSGLLIFTLFNSSDAFLLLAMKERHVSDTGMIGMYIFYNLVYALLSYPLGILADRIGLKTTLVAGLVLFAFVYMAFGFAGSYLFFIILFFFYGIYAATTEGISKALITNLAGRADTATAVGFYASFASIFSMISSSLAGILWFTVGMRSMFIISGIGVLLASFYLIGVSLLKKH